MEEALAEDEPAEEKTVEEQVEEAVAEALGETSETDDSETGDEV